MCTCENAFTASWNYYLVERDVNTPENDVIHAWSFGRDWQKARETLLEEAERHPDRSYQIYKSVD